MVSFTIENYMKYAPKFLERWILMEDKEEYNISQKATHQYQDKIFKEILDNRKELLYFIKYYLENDKFKKVEEEEIENCRQKFITSNLKVKEADMIYKIKDKNVYILIEHQSKVDKNMPIRMVEYCLELGKTVCKYNKGKFPTIYPIVLYTGNRKWNIPTTIEISEQDSYDYGIQKSNYPVYSLIDINNYSNERLIKESTELSKALLFEKVKSKDVIKMLEKLNQKVLTIEERKCITKILKYSNKIRKILPSNSEYFEKIMKGDAKDMRFEETFLQALEDNFKKGIKEGIKSGEKRGEKRGVSKMIKQMIKNHIGDEQIMKIAQIDEEKLKELKMV